MAPKQHRQFKEQSKVARVRSIRREIGFSWRLHANLLGRVTVIGQEPLQAFRLDQSGLANRTMAQ
ncbi:hypothetical protein [Novosphingobium sp.]|uniref:hypothetical protein n=1 Tax=Novosphingobium sp. TaxID=1874826 RepID=UPI00286E9ED5|nr:hypothetical protein [Novosphingobium sp.]